MMREHWKWTPLVAATAFAATFALAFLRIA